MEEKKKKAITSLLFLLDTEGFSIFEAIPYLQLIRPLVKLDRKEGKSYQQIANRYDISKGQARRILKSMSNSDKV
jgi:hypothetical protein